MKIPKKFKQVKAGEWVQPIMNSYLLQCCDCSLIHRMNFKVRIDSKGTARVLMQAFRVKSRNKDKF